MSSLIYTDPSKVARNSWRKVTQRHCSSGAINADSLAAVAELVPNKRRGIVQACLDLMLLPWSVFGVSGADDFERT